MFFLKKKTLAAPKYLGKIAITCSVGRHKSNDIQDRQGPRVLVKPSIHEWFI